MAKNFGGKLNFVNPQHSNFPSTCSNYPENKTGESTLKLSNCACTKFGGQTSLIKKHTESIIKHRYCVRVAMARKGGLKNMEKEKKNTRKLVIGKDVTKVENFRYSQNKEIEEIEFPDSLTEIGYNSFAGCENLKEVDIPEGVISIKDGAFFACTKLKRVKFPSTLQCICVNAFKYCELLEDLNLPENLACIQEEAFAYCNQLSTVFIPAKTEYLARDAFLGCEKLEKIEINKENKNYQSVDGVMYTKDKTCLMFCPQGKKNQLHIPEGVLAIVNNSLLGCKKLDHVHYPDSLEKISSNSHVGCGLKFLEIPSNVNLVESSSFRDCERLGRVKIGESVKKIEPLAFLNCRNIEYVVFNSGLETIGIQAFDNCSSLKSVCLPSSVEKIHSKAFDGCNNLQTVIIHGNPSVGINAFPEHTNVLYVQEHLKFSFPGANEQQEELEVYKTEEGLLYHTSGKYTLEFLCIDGKDRAFWKDVDNTFFSSDFKTLFSYSPDNKAKEYTVPSHVEFIEDCAFLDNPCIEKIHLHENIKQAGKYAIANCPNMDEELKKAINNKKTKQNDCELQI